MPHELLDEIEALYAPPSDTVFELVPPAFHDHVASLYSEIGEPAVNVDSFWPVYCNLLGKL